MNPRPLSRFLVYGLIDPRTAELRYVGKSSRGMIRPKRHLSDYGRKGGVYRCCWLRQLYKEGLLPSILVLKECQSEDEVLIQEKILIALFKEFGFDLTNLTDGGEKLGFHFSEETKLKMINAHLGVKLSPEHAAKSRVARLGGKNSPEAIAKTRASRIGYKHSDETRVKMSKALCGRKQSDEERAKRSGRKPSDETRAKISKALCGRKISDEERAKRIGRKHSDETKAKMSKDLRGRKISKESIEKIRISMKEYWSKKKIGIMEDRAGYEECR